jgi:hypothetical protein
MKSAVLAICVCVLGACGKKRAPDPAVDRYINQELAPHLAKVSAARAGYDDISAAMIDTPDNLPNLTHRLTDAALPFLTQALDGIGKVTPPEHVKYLHDALLALVTEERAAIEEMSKALDPIDLAAFKQGHERMMEVQPSRLRWNDKLEGVLGEYAIKMNELPDVDVPKPRPRRPAATPPPAAPPCVPGTEVKTGDVIVECTTTEGIAGLCSAGKMTFHATGAPKTCTTELMFAAPGADPATPKDQMALCGPGEVALDPAGAVIGCVAASEVMVSGTKVPEGAKLVLGAKAKVVSAELPDGKVVTSP